MPVGSPRTLRLSRAPRCPPGCPVWHPGPRDSSGNRSPSVGGSSKGSCVVAHSPRGGPVRPRSPSPVRAAGRSQPAPSAAAVPPRQPPPGSGAAAPGRCCGPGVAGRHGGEEPRPEESERARRRGTAPRRRTDVGDRVGRQI